MTATTLQLPTVQLAAGTVHLSTTSPTTLASTSSLTAYPDGRGTLGYIEEERGRGPIERYFWRALEAGELAELRTFVSTSQVDHLARKEYGAFDGVEYRWTHAMAAEAWQVVLNNPREDAQPQMELIGLLTQFRDAKPLTCEYPMGLPEKAEILCAQPMNSVRRVWAKGEDIRALIGPSEMTTEEWYRLKEGRWERGEAPPRADGREEESSSDGSGMGERPRRWRGKEVASVGDGYNYKKGTYLIEYGKAWEKLFDSMMEYQIVVPETNLLVGTLDGHLICYDLEKRQGVSLLNAEDLQEYQVFEYLGVCDS